MSLRYISYLNCHECCHVEARNLISPHRLHFLSLLHLIYCGRCHFQNALSSTEAADSNLSQQASTLLGKMNRGKCVVVVVKELTLYSTQQLHSCSKTKKVAFRDCALQQIAKVIILIERRIVLM